MLLFILSLLADNRQPFVEFTSPSQTPNRLHRSEFMVSNYPLDFVVIGNLLAQYTPLCQVALNDLPRQSPRLSPVSFMLFFRLQSIRLYSIAILLRTASQ